MRKLYITEDKNKKFLLEKLRGEKDLSSIVMGYTEFLHAYFFDYTEKTLFYIVETYQVTREIAQIYVSELYFLNENVFQRERLLFLQKLKTELIEKQLLVFKPMFSHWLKNYSLCFYHITLEDVFFANLVRNLKEKYEVQIVSFPKNERKIQYYPAVRMEEEVVFVCASMVQLLQKGISSQNIYLTNLSSEYRLLFQLYGKFFHLNFQFLEGTSIFSTSLVQTFLKRMREDWTLVFEDLLKQVHTKQEEQVYTLLVQTCNSFLNFSRNELFYSYLRETLEQLSIPSFSYQESILEFDFLHSEVKSDAYVFLVGANQGFFPSLFKDTEFLSEQDLKELKLSKNSEKNQFIVEQTKSRLMYYPHLVLSYKLSSMDGEFFPSSILEEMVLEEVEFSKWFSYSTLYNQLTYAKEMDLYQKYGMISENLKTLFSTYHEIPYRTYQNQFQSFSLKEPVVSVLSYSSIDLYHRCPFRFYLAYILKLKKVDSSFSLKIGKLYHAILQKFYDSNFNFEQAFTCEKEKLGTLSKKDAFFLEKFATYLKTFFAVLQEQEQYSSLKNVLCEQEIMVSLPHGMQFRGVLDKIYYDDDKMVVVDYKTGNIHLDLNLLSYGIEMQLPIYLYLLANSPFQNKTIVGFYLQKVIPNIMKGDRKHSKEELLKKNFMLYGYSNSMEASIQSFDSNYQDSKVIQGMKVGTHGFYSYTKRLSSEQINAMIQFVQDKVYEAERQIYRQKFPIHPKQIGGILRGCEYCPYQSVCYKTEVNIDYLEEQRPKFLGGEEDGMDEGTTTSY